MSILPVNSCSIDQESGEICTGQTDLQQIYSKSDSLLKSEAFCPGPLELPGAVVCERLWLRRFQKCPFTGRGVIFQS